MSYMAGSTRPFSARVDASVLERLERRGARSGTNKSRLAERYIDEGLRLDDHPGIVFRDGPTGRRAGLVGGPDDEVDERVRRNLDEAEAAEAAWRREQALLR